MVTAENYPEFRGVIYKMLSDMEKSIANTSGEETTIALKEILETVGD